MANAVGQPRPVLARQAGDQRVLAGGQFSFALPTSSFLDPSGGTLSYTAMLENNAPLPSWLSFDATKGTFSGTAPAGTAALAIKVVATSSSGAQSAEAFHLYSAPPAPVLAHQQGDVALKAGQAFSFALPAGSFTDTAGGTVTYTASLPDGTKLPSWVSFDPSTGKFSGTAPSGASTLTVAVTAHTAAGGVSTEAFKLVAQASGNPVLVRQQGDLRLAAGASFSTSIPAGAFSDPSGGTVTYSVTMTDGSKLPSWVTFDPKTLAISGTVPVGKSVSGFMVTATTSGGGVAAEAFRLYGTPTNPVLAQQQGDVRGLAGTSFRLAIAPSAFTDPQGGQINYKVTLADGSALPSWMAFDRNTGILVGVMPAGATNQAVMVTATTQAGGVAAEAFHVYGKPGADSEVAPGASADIGLVAVGAPDYAPGSHVITVGTGKQFQTIGAAVDASHDGDVVLVDAGTYTNDFVTTRTKITLEAVGGRVTMNATVPPPNLKGIITQETDLAVKGFTFTGAAIDQGNGGNAAGIRIDGGNLDLFNDAFMQNQNGVLSNPGNYSVTMDHCLFDDNGIGGDGHIHNVYLGDISSAVATNSIFRNAQVGHEFKSRAETNILVNNQFVGGVGIGTGSYDVDLPNGGADTLIGNTIVKGSNAQNNAMVHFGGEGIPYGGSSLSLSGNLFQVQGPIGATGVLNQTPISVKVTGSVLQGLAADHQVSGPGSAKGSRGPDGSPLPDQTLVGVLPGGTQVINDALPHSVTLVWSPNGTAIQGGAGYLKLDVATGHVIIIGGTGGMDVEERPDVTGGNQITTAAGSTNLLNLAGLGMNLIDSEGTDTINCFHYNQSGQINGTAIVNEGEGDDHWTVNGNATFTTGTGSTFIQAGTGATLSLIGVNTFFQIDSSGATTSWNTVNAGSAVAGSAVGGAYDMKVFNGTANITTSGGREGVTMHLDTGSVHVMSSGADTIYAGSGDANIIVGGAAKVYAGTGSLSLYGRGDYAGADFYGNGGTYLIDGDTGNITYHGGDKDSTVNLNLSNNTILGGAGKLTVVGGSRETIVGGSGGLVFDNVTGGANTVTTMAGSTNLIRENDTFVHSFGTDTITHVNGNNGMDVHGDSTITVNTGNFGIDLYGNDVLNSLGGGQNVTVHAGAAATITQATNGHVTSKAAALSLTFNGNSAGSAATVVNSSGAGGVDIWTTQDASGISTDGTAPAVVTVSGAARITSAGADTITTGSGIQSVNINGSGATVQAGSGTLSVTDWGGPATVRGGSGSVSVNSGDARLTFIGGSGSASLSGSNLAVIAGSGDISVGVGMGYGAGVASFVGGSGKAVLNLGGMPSDITFGSGATTVSGLGYGGADTYRFLSAAAGRDYISNFKAGVDKAVLGSGLTVASSDTAFGSAHFVLSNGADVTFAGIATTKGIFA